MPFFDVLDTWWFGLKDRAVGAFFWQAKNNTAIFVPMCLMFVIGLCIVSLLLVSHRQIKREAYRRGLKKGYEAGYDEAEKDCLKQGQATLWMLAILSYIALWLVVLFGFWGGQPEGVYLRIENVRWELKQKLATIQLNIDKLQADIAQLEQQSLQDLLRHKHEQKTEKINFMR